MNTIKTPLEIIKDLKPCQWEYKSEQETGMNLGSGVNFGFIAQDLQETFGEQYNFVDSSGEYLRVNYTQFIGILTSVVKDQQTKIEMLEKQIAEIKGAHNVSL